MHHQIVQSSLIPKEIWGALISGIIGIMLFVIKSHIDTRERESNLLFHIYRLIKQRRVYTSTPEREAKVPEKERAEVVLREVAYHALQIKSKKNRKIARDIFIFVTRASLDSNKENEILSDIERHINKKLINELIKMDRENAK